MSPESKDIGDSLGLVDLLPQGNMLDQIDFECPKSYHALSLLFFYETSLISKQTFFNIDALRIDTDLAGTDKFPAHYLSKREPHNKSWHEMKHNFIVVSLIVPPIKEIAYKAGNLSFEHYNPNEKYEIKICDIRNGNSVSITTKRIHFGDEGGESNVEKFKFLAQYLIEV